MLFFYFKRGQLPLTNTKLHKIMIYACWDKTCKEWTEIIIKRNAHNVCMLRMREIDFQSVRWLFCAFIYSFTTGGFCERATNSLQLPIQHFTAKRRLVKWIWQIVKYLTDTRCICISLIDVWTMPWRRRAMTQCFSDAMSQCDVIGRWC